MKTIDMYENVITALCVWREARGESYIAKFLVASVIFNRSVDTSHRWPMIPSSVVLQPKQFSSFNVDDPNSSKMPAFYDENFKECCRAVDVVFPSEGDVDTHSEALAYLTHTENSIAAKANHYHDISIDTPEWAKGMEYLGQVGHFKFYRG